MDEKNVPESGTERSGTVPDIPLGDYLFALLRYADWIDPCYRRVAQRERDVDYLHALYLCAADQVPFEKVVEASGKKNAAKALLLIRQKHLEDRILGEHRAQIHEMSEKTIKMEQQLSSMTQQIGRIASSMPESDLVYEDVPAEAPQDQDVSGEEGKNAKQQDVPESGTIAPEPQPDTTGAGIRISLERWLKKHKADREQKALTQFLNGLFEEKFSADQVSFLLDCIEQGASIEEMKGIAVPGLPVEVMDRLYRLQKKKGE